MKNIWPVIALVLGVILILVLLFDNDPEPVNTQAFKNTITKLEGQIVELTASRQVLLNEIRQDSISGRKTQDSLSSRLNAKSREVERLKRNPIIIRVREEVPEVDSLILAQDSVIVLQDHRIAAYTHQLGRLQTSMVGITANFENNLRLEQQRYQAQVQLTAEYKKENRKVKRANRWLKVGAVAGTVAAFLLGSQL